MSQFENFTASASLLRQAQSDHAGARTAAALVLPDKELLRLSLHWLRFLGWIARSHSR